MSEPAPALTESPGEFPTPTHHKAEVPVTEVQSREAELIRQPSLRERLAWYFGAMLLSCLLVTAGLRLDTVDLKAPLYYDLDSLLILPMVKVTAEHGFGAHWRNERMGAPGVQELYDFPVIDHLHFLIIAILSHVVSHVVLLYNVYFLLTFPLTVLTAMLVFRQLGLTLPAAAVGGILYSFLPYHYQRWENHYFLAAYWVVPLSLLPAFAITRGELLFFRQSAEGKFQFRFFQRRTIGWLLLTLATASAGAYYAFFACGIIAFSGLYGWAVSRNWRAMVSAGGVIAMIVAFGLLNHLPTYIFQATHGQHPVTDRYAEEADHYGLKIAHMVLPIEDHNLRLLNDVKWRYNSALRPSETENRSASLGLIGTAGLFGLVAVTLLPIRSPWPIGPLAGMTLFTVLLATIGGFGSIFNLLVTPQIRAYNRISVFIAFFALFAFMWAFDRFLLTRTGERAKRLRYPAWAVVLLIGFLDQTPFSWFKSGIIRTIGEQGERFHADARFFGDVERQMSGASRVFCLPYCPFPESAAVHRMPAYEHARGYIHTDGLSVSFGAIKGREADTWQREVVSRPPDEMLRRIVFAGFDGLFVDQRGFAITPEGNGATVLMATLQQLYADLAGQPTARLPEIKHEDGEQFFLDLRPYRDLLRKKLVAPYDFETESRKERERISIVWLDGFYSDVNDRGETQTLRYGTRDGTAWVINPTDRTRTIELSMVFGTVAPGPFRFNLSGLVNSEFEVDRVLGSWDPRQFGMPMQFAVEVPPGRHKIRIKCTPPAYFIANDNRRIAYYILDVRVREP